MAAIAAVAQTPAPWPKPSFEVASIKPTTARGPVNTSPGGEYVAAGQPLKALIALSHRIRGFQVLGGPAWVGTDLWEIQAKAPEGRVPARSTQRDLNKPDVMDLMLQSLLEDRFQLKLHQETRQLPVYELVVAKGGPKLTLSENQGPILPRDPSAPIRRQPNGLPEMIRGMYSIGGFGTVPGGRKFEGKAIALSALINQLIGMMNRPIIDKTNLTGLYDIKLEWIPDNLQATPGGPPAPDSEGPTLTTAIQEQLGLRLESTKGPVEVIVIDSVQRPTEN
jgi:uncharacterized protein (TIGR03435 family)